MIVSLIELDEIKIEIQKLIPDVEIKQETDKLFSEFGKSHNYEYEYCLLKSLLDWFKSINFFILIN